MSQLQVAVESLVQRWRQEPVELIPPVSASDVRRALSELGPLVTEDIVEIYSTTGGMVEGEMDDNHFFLWPMERVLAEFFSRDSTDVQFADFLIDSHRYAFRFVSPETSSVIQSHYDPMEPTYDLYKSASEFFERYAAASDENAAFSVLHGI